jgi:hypothetical protein
MDVATEDYVPADALTVEWRPDGPRRSVFEEIGEQLRARPGEWAVFPTVYTSRASAANTASAIRLGRLVALGEGPFEATYDRTVDGSGHRVSARYVPAPAAMTVAELDRAVNATLTVGQMRSVLNRLIVAAPEALALAVLAELPSVEGEGATLAELTGRTS